MVVKHVWLVSVDSKLYLEANRGIWERTRCQKVGECGRKGGNWEAREQARWMLPLDVRVD